MQGAVSSVPTKKMNDRTARHFEGVRKRRKKMTTKRFEVAEHTCDRCGAHEVDKRDLGATEESISYKGIALTIGSREERVVLDEPALVQLAVKAGYPNSHSLCEIRLRLCSGCRGELVTFLNAKQ